MNDAPVHDLLARRHVSYGQARPVPELHAGVGKMAVNGRTRPPIRRVGPPVGGVAAVGVMRAVHIDRRDLICARAGGGGTMAFGSVSLTANPVRRGTSVRMRALRSAG